MEPVTGYLTTYISRNSPRLDGLLVSGPENSGKSSVLFNLACEYARLGEIVYFVCYKDKMEAKLPKYFSEHQNSSDTFPYSCLKQISMKYYQNLQDLKKFLVGIPSLSPQPSILIIDDLGLMVNLTITSISPQYNDQGSQYGQNSSNSEGISPLMKLLEIMALLQNISSIIQQSSQSPESTTQPPSSPISPSLTTDHVGDHIECSKVDGLRYVIGTQFYNSTTSPIFQRICSTILDLEVKSLTEIELRHDNNTLLIFHPLIDGCGEDGGGMTPSSLYCSYVIENDCEEELIEGNEEMKN